MMGKRGKTDHDIEALAKNAIHSKCLDCTYKSVVNEVKKKRKSK